MIIIFFFYTVRLINVYESKLSPKEKRKGKTRTERKKVRGGVRKY